MGPSALGFGPRGGEDRRVDILFSETITTAAALAAQELRAAGHTVHRCHYERDHGVRCTALRGGSCPLDIAPIDVAVTVRAVDGTAAMPADDGVLCAIRHKVPVVVAGDVRRHPFEDLPHIRAYAGESILSAVDAATAVLPEHSLVATAEARRRAGDDAIATVSRRDARLHADVQATSDHPERVGVRVAGALRAFDPHVRGIDVEVHP